MALDELQIEILLRTLDSENQRIHVLLPHDGEEGEVKAGNTRIPGDATVIAVGGLQTMGLVADQDDTALVLTDDGRRVAKLHAGKID